MFDPEQFQSVHLLRFEEGLQGSSDNRRGGGPPGDPEIGSVTANRFQNDGVRGSDRQRPEQFRKQKALLVPPGETPFLHPQSSKPVAVSNQTLFHAPVFGSQDSQAVPLDPRALCSGGEGTNIKPDDGQRDTRQEYAPHRPPTPSDTRAPGPLPGPPAIRWQEIHERSPETGPD